MDNFTEPLSMMNSFDVVQALVSQAKIGEIRLMPNYFVDETDTIGMFE